MLCFGAGLCCFFQQEAVSGRRHRTPCAKCYHANMLVFDRCKAHLVHRLSLVSDSAARWSNKTSTLIILKSPKDQLLSGEEAFLLLLSQSSVAVLSLMFSIWCLLGHKSDRSNNSRAAMFDSEAAVDEARLESFLVHLRKPLSTRRDASCHWMIILYFTV